MEIFTLEIFIDFLFGTLLLGIFLLKRVFLGRFLYLGEFLLRRFFGRICIYIFSQIHIIHRQHTYAYSIQDNYLEVFNSKRLFVDISRIGSTSQCTHGSQVATVSSLGLDDKHSSFRTRCGLFYSITYLYKQCK